MIKFRHLLLCLCLPLLFSCDGQRAETATEGEQAIAEYRNYVTEFEQDSLTETEMRALEQSAEDDSRWETEKLNLQEMYDERREVVQNLEDLDETERAEVEALDERYNQALQRRERQYEEVERRKTLRRDLLGLEIRNLDMSDITAENIGNVYDRFISTLSENVGEYEQRDWNQIEGWWNSLNNRYQAIEGDLQAPVKNSIQQAKNRYLQIREEANIGNV
ncbi:hypothetical protein ACFS7Z_00390 [Pontibacter toksunensis]|uniref:Uncharacterized protein n=1 Tax=Pontibacter toksunensis TaxID=1332631 RepID=A0ABW6BML0_9BACT